MLTHPYNVHFTMFNFVVHCIFEYKFNNVEDINVFCFEVWHHSDLAGSGPVDMSDVNCCCDVDAVSC